MQGLTVGRIVHFVMPSHEHRPAIVVKVFNLKSACVGLVNLIVFVDGLNDIKPTTHTLWETSICFDEDKKLPGTWHWIEKA